MTVRARTLEPFGSDPGERATMARGLAFLLAAGATLVAATLVLLPQPDGTQEVGLWIPVAIAYGLSAVLIGARGRLGAGALQIVIAGATLLITSCVVHGGDAGAAYPMMYVWVALYAHYFFSLRAAVLQTLLCGAAYAGALIATDGISDAGLHWVMALGTLAVAGALIGQLTETARIQTADLAAVAEIGAVSDGTDFAQAVCEGLRRSVSADVVVLLQPLPDASGLRVTGMAGAAAAGATLTAPVANAAIEAAFAHRGPRTIEQEASQAGPFGGATTGFAQPVLRDGEAIGVLAVGWTRPRRRISDRVSSAAALFASEAALAIERQRAAARERERHALEINDNIVQGLVVAKYAAAGGHVDQAVKAIDDTLGRARRLITRQLDDVGGADGRIRPGDLVRDEASNI